MANQIGGIPEFTQDEITPVTPEVPPEEVKEAQPEPVEPEKDTPAPPAEKPLPEAGKEEYSEPLDQEVKKAINSLQEDRAKLLKEISELRGQKRQLKQTQLEAVQEKIDELKDLHPQDVEVIERVLRAKGLMTRKEANQMFYEAVKEEELNKFLEKYPEYKPENDPGDANWNALQRELGYYRTPDNPRQIADILERSHRSIVRPPSDFGLASRKRQVEIASVGRGGAQRSSTIPKLDPVRRSIYERGGWTEEEIQQIEKKLSS